MVKFRDLKKTLSLRSIELSAQENQLLIFRAAREIAERSVLGAIIVPLCFAMAVISSGYVVHSPYTCFVLACIMTGSAVVRRLAIARIRNNPIELLSHWVNVFYLSCLGMAAVWGFTTAIFLYNYGDSFSVLLIFVLSAGIGAGSITNFCIWRALAVNYLLVSIAPVILVGLLIRQADFLPAILAMIFFFFYLVVQIKRWNFHFWDSLITAYLFERQAEKLSETNRNLAEIIEKEKNASQEVERSRLKIWELFNLTNDGIVVYTLDGRVLDVNQAMLDMFSGGREAIEKNVFLQLFTMPAESNMTVQDHWQKVIDGAENDFECKVTRSGRQAPLQVHVNLRRVTWQEEQVIFVTLRDITARKQMEEALKTTRRFLSEREGYLQAILCNVELPIYCKDLKGCYLTVNAPFEQLCCRTLKELLGKNDMQVFPEKIGRFFSFRDTEIVETGESFELEGIFTFDGQEKNLLVHKFPLKESGGNIYATGGICTDVTILKKALRAAQLANETRSEFLANMSHELRTPLNSILSVARLGIKRVNTSSPDKLESYFKMIVSSGDRLLELLSDILDLSTLESAKVCYSFKEYDLAKDLEKVVAEFRVLMDERKISLNFQSPGFSAPARYDRTKLYQVVRNLLANAMKFTSPHKEVKVVLQKDYLEIDGGRQSAWKVMVIDQGVGVEEDELELVFGKFVRGSKANREVGGVGLGLSICKRIIEDHHGIIWAERNETEGATFCFLLPGLE